MSGLSDDSEHPAEAKVQGLMGALFDAVERAKAERRGAKREPAPSDAFDVARDLLTLTPANAVEAHLLEVLADCVTAHEAALSGSSEAES